MLVDTPVPVAATTGSRMVRGMRSRLVLHVVDIHWQPDIHQMTYRPFRGGVSDASKVSTVFVLPRPCHHVRDVLLAGRFQYLSFDPFSLRSSCAVLEPRRHGSMSCA